MTDRTAADVPRIVWLAVAGACAYSVIHCVYSGIRSIIQRTLPLTTLNGWTGNGARPRWAGSPSQLASASP